MMEKRGYYHILTKSGFVGGSASRRSPSVAGGPVTNMGRMGGK
jgi:hypothetical protein